MRTMRTLENSIVIARLIDEVFPYVTNPDSWVVWSGPVIAVRGLEPATPHPGATFTTVVKLLGRQFEMLYRVTEFEQNREFVYTSESGPLPSTFTWASNRF